MLDQTLELLKHSVAASLGLVMSVFGVVGGQTANISQSLETTSIQEDSLVQEEVLESFDSSEIEDVAEEIKVITEEIDELEDTIEESKEIKYFDRENVPIATFARPEPINMNTSLDTEVEKPLVNLGEIEIEEVRAVNPIKTAKPKNEVDVSLILNTDLDNYDFKLQISEITEDNDNYYIEYQYKTLAVDNKVWKEKLEKKTLSISKDILDGADLGNYLSEELAEVIDMEMVYLKEVQEIQKIKKAKAAELALREKERMVSKDYSSLIGKVLDLKQEDFGDYEPIIAVESIEEISNISELTSAETEIAEESEIIEEEIIEDNTTSSGIVDNQAPMLVIQGNNPALIQIGTSYVDLGAKVTDNISEGLGVKVSGDIVDTNVKDSYFITYTAIDEAGNVASATREVIVYDYGTTPSKVDQIKQEVVEEQEKTEEVSQEIIKQDELKQEKEVVSPVEKEKVNPSEKENDKELATSSPELTQKESRDKKEEKDKNIMTAVQETVDVVAETTTEAIDTSVEVAQETVETAVETTVEVIDTSAEVIQETVDKVVETTNEVVVEKVEQVIESTSEITEQIIAMLVSIDLKHLLGNVSSSINKDPITNKVVKILDETSITVYEKINNLLMKIGSVKYKKSEDRVKVSNKEFVDENKPIDEIAIKEVGNTNQVISESQIDENIYKDDNWIDFVKYSFNETKEIVKKVTNKVSNNVSLAGIKYFNKKELEDLEDQKELKEQKITIDLDKKEKEESKNFFEKILKFIKDNKPKI